MSQYAARPLRRSVQLAWRDRWFAMVAIAVQDVLPASLLVADGRQVVLDQGTAREPNLSELLDGQRWELDFD